MKKKHLFIPLLFLIFLSSSSLPSRKEKDLFKKEMQFEILTNHYTWYEDNWNEGGLPTTEPLKGYYNSADQL